jgi:hypothetical protein
MKTYKEFMTEAKTTYFDVKTAEEWKKDILKGIKAPHVRVNISTLGGDEDVSIMIKFSLDEDADKSDVAWHNSRKAHLSIQRDGTLAMSVYANHKIPIKALRKSKIKSAKDVIKKINDWIGKVE